MSLLKHLTEAASLYSVRNWGADPNTGADQTAFFDAAHDAMPAAGGVLYVPDGEYALYRWTITKPIVVWGPGATLKNFSASTSDANDLVIINAGNVGLLRIKILGGISTSGTQPAPHALVAVGTDAGQPWPGVRIQECRLIGGRSGVNSTHLEDAWITQNTIQSQWDYGILGPSFCDRVQITDNQISDIYRNSGIRTGALSGSPIPQTNDLVISRNTLTNCGRAGDQDAIDVSTSNGCRVRVDGNTIAECPGAIEIKVDVVGTDYTDISICDNVITGSNDAQIGCDIACNFNGDLQDHMKRVLIAGNQMSTQRDILAGTYGVICNAYKDVTIRDNQIYGTTYGVRLDIGAFNLNRPVIKDNVIDSGYGIYCTSSAGGVVASATISGNEITYLFSGIFNRSTGAIWTRPKIKGNSFNRRVANVSGSAAIRMTGLQGALITKNDFDCFGNAIAIEDGLTNTEVVITKNNCDTSDATDGSDCINVTASTGTIEIYNNSLRPKSGSRGWVTSGAGATVLAGKNKRGVRSSSPTGVLAGSLNDTFDYSAPVAGATHVVCTSGGPASGGGAAVWTDQ